MVSGSDSSQEERPKVLSRNQTIADISQTMNSDKENLINPTHKSYSELLSKPGKVNEGFNFDETEMAMFTPRYVNVYRNELKRDQEENIYDSVDQGAIRSAMEKEKEEGGARKISEISRGAESVVVINDTDSLLDEVPRYTSEDRYSNGSSYRSVSVKGHTLLVALSLSN